MKVLDLFSLKGKVAVVTGGTGLYGKYIVEALAEAKAITYVVSRNLKNCEKLAISLRKKGYKVQSGEVDLCQEDSIKRLYEKIITKEKRIDILVNNAVLRPMKSYNDPIENFRVSMEVNAVGVFNLTRLFAKNMIKNRIGSIMNISSIQGVTGPDFNLYEGTNMDTPPDYFFHKAGLISLTRYLAARLGPYNIRVNCVSPGGLFNNQTPKFVERYNKRTFLGRMALGNDIKGVIVFLASDASLYVTGANILIDGGYTAK